MHTRQIKLSEDVNLEVIAGITIGMDGAQLASLCNEAAHLAARHGHDRVQRADFEAALDKLVPGDIRPPVPNEKTHCVIACHEGGHALVAWLTPDWLASHRHAHEVANNTELVDLLCPRPRPPHGEPGAGQGRHAAARIAACHMTESAVMVYPPGAA